MFVTVSDTKSKGKLPGPVLTLVQSAENAARNSGTALWYVPPDQYAPRSVNGPFVNSDQSGGVPTVGSGLVGFVRNTATFF